MKRFLQVTLLLGAAALTTGCVSALNMGSSEYGCKGMPDGVTCKSARQVYDLTEADDFRAKVEADQKAAAEGKKGHHEEATQEPRAVSGQALVVPLPARNPLPIRTQATVMRIWVAPWESADGDLNVPGYVYTEIQPRRWELGVSAPESQPTLRPLQVNMAARSSNNEPQNTTGAAGQKPSAAARDVVRDSQRAIHQAQ